MLKHVDETSAVKNSGICCLALIFNLSNPKTTILHAKNLFKKPEVANTTSHVLFFLQINTHSWLRMAQWFLGSAASWSELGNKGSIPTGTE